MAEFVQLGKSDVHVFPVALGANAVGGHNLYPNLDEEQGKDVVRKAIDNGITLIDTAFIYGPKRSEELVGEVVKEYPREKVQIATKGSHVIKDNGDVVQNNQPDYLKQQVHDGIYTWYVRNQERSFDLLLRDLNIDEGLVQHELTKLLVPVLQQLITTGHLRRRARMYLEKFYYSEKALDILNNKGA